MTRLVYMIKRVQMLKSERVEVLDFPDLVNTLTRYVSRFGPIDMLYLESKP